MLELADHEIREKIHESRRTVVYRGQRRSDGRKVIVKTHRHERPSPATIARLRREYEIGASFAGPGVVEYLAVETDGHSVAVITEDFGGVDLRTRAAALHGDLGAFLSIAASLAEGLSVIHGRDVIHQDVKPANIVVNPQTRAVKFIDFGLASELVRERRDPTGLAGLQGTLAYVSPEQTGRTNRTIDHRTDLYSLGVTLYELLCGRLPFVTTDALELIHSHIAKPAVPPRALDETIPAVVSELIMTLLAKNAEERYQTARGLQRDLSRCQRALEEDGRIEAFALRTDDRSDVLQLSQRLYGRDAEQAQLLGAFERCSAGGRELVVVRGPAGIGKSSLIDEVHRPMTEARGYFTRGKSDLLHKNVPYAALLQALRSLLQQILTESESRLRRWRRRLLDALGPNAQVVVAVLPELAHVVGDRPAPPEVGPAEARRRFDRTFLRLVGAFAHREHPLVIVLDDLQWADGATLRILSSLLTGSDTSHLLVIGAHRSDDPGEARSVEMMAADVREAGGAVGELELEALVSDDVSRLVADSLGIEVERAQPLGALLFDKTRGNPFFVGELLRSLHADGLLGLEDGQWRWDEAAIGSRGVADNVVDLLVEGVRVLPQDTQRILRVAASMGTRFSLELLALVTAEPTEAVAQRLRGAIRAGLVQPRGELYKLAELGMPEGAGAEYRFVHDRVHEAAYSLLTEAERTALHWRVGKLLLEHTPESQRDSRIFDIVNQLSLGLELAEGDAERLEVARLHLRAGQEAAASTAYGPALEFLRQGIELLGEQPYARAYELASQLHTLACRAAQLCGDLEQMQRIATAALANTGSMLEKVPIHEIQMRAHTAQGKLADALALGLDVLDSLGVELPREPGPAEIAEMFQDVGARLAERGVEELMAWPGTDDPQVRAKTRILEALATPAYVTRPSLYPMVAGSLVATMLEDGATAESAMGFAMFGLLSCAVLGDYGGGQRYGRVARALCGRLDAAFIEPRVAMAVHGLITHWHNPLQDTCAPLRASSLQALDNGDPEWGGHCIFIYALHALFTGQRLDALEAEMASHAAVLAKAGQQTAVTWINNDRQHMRNLLGHAEDPTRMRGEAYDEQVMAPIHEAYSDLVSSYHLHFNTAVLSFLFRDYQRARRSIDEAGGLLHAVPGLILVPLFHFYDSLILLATIGDATEEERAVITKRVADNQDKLHAWSEITPVNHRHKWLLVEAERHAAEGRVLEAMDAYDEAIALASAHRYRNEAALANERAAEFWLARRKIDFATSYARAARYDYERWGAHAKVEDLDARYRGLRVETVRPLDASTSISSSTRPPIMLGDTPQLDVGSVLKATRVISEEMDLERAITTLLAIVIENAGARRGYILLPDETRELRIQASGSVMEDSVVVEHAEPGEVGSPLGQTMSEAVVRYVVRTNEPLVLDDAAKEGMFTKDPWVVATGVRSVLCMPFSAPMMGQRSAGVVYLENVDAAGVFSHDRVRVLKLITAQAAISLENARLYGDLRDINLTLEQLVEERTKELRQAQRALVRASRKAGQAEVAENLLHNAGNTLNRLTVAAGLLEERSKLPAVDMLTKVIGHLSSPDHELSKIFESGGKGRRLLELISSIGRELGRSRRALRESTNSMGQVVDELVEILRRHDEFSGSTLAIEAFMLGTLLDEAIETAGLTSHATITVTRDYRPEPLIHSDRYRLERLVMALLRYSRSMVEEAGDSEPATITIRTMWTGKEVQVVIGVGEHAEDWTLDTGIFSQRRTSHPDVPTVHDCAISASKLGGALQCYAGRSSQEVHFVLTLEVGAPTSA